MIPVKDTAHVKAIGSTIICGALTMGQAGVLGPGPTAEKTTNTNPSYREAYIQEARRKGAGRMEEEKTWRGSSRT